MKLKTAQALQLFAGLQALDGVDRIVREGTADRVVRDYFKINGRVRMKIARNVIALRSIVDAHNDTRNALILSIGDGSGALTDAGQIAEFERQMQGALDAYHEIELATLTEAEIDLSANQYPIATLIAIEPLIAIGPHLGKGA